MLNDISQTTGTSISDIAQSVVQKNLNSSPQNSAQASGVTPQFGANLEQTTSQVNPFKDVVPQVSNETFNAQGQQVPLPEPQFGANLEQTMNAISNPFQAAPTPPTTTVQTGSTTSSATSTSTSTVDQAKSAGAFDAPSKEADVYFQGALQQLAFEKEQDAADGLLKNLNTLKEFTTENLQQEIVSIEGSYAKQLENLKIVEDTMNQAFAKQQAAIEAGSSAMLAEAKSAYEANKQVYEYQRDRTNLAYQELLNAQELANRKREVAEEAMIARLGAAQYGNIDHMADTIVQNEFKINQLKKEADLEDQKLTGEIKSLNDQYSTDLQKIYAWKAESISGVYDSHAQMVERIKNNENLTYQQQQQAIQEATNRANQSLADIMTKSMDAQYNASLQAAERVDSIIQAKNEAQEKAREWTRTLQEDAKSELSSLLEVYKGTSFSELDAGAKARMQDAALKANLPESFLENAMEKINEAYVNEQLSENFKIDKYFEDGKGNVVAVINDAGRIYTQSLGKIGKQPSSDPTKWQIEEVNGSFYKFNPMTNEMIPVSGADRGAIGGLINNGIQDALLTDFLGNEYADGEWGGQCGSFMHNFVDMSFVKGGKWTDTLAGKKERMNLSFNDFRSDPQVGDVLLTNENPSTGHITMVLEKDLEGRMVRLLESNRLPPNQELVSTSRWVSIDDSMIQGVYRGPLKPKYEELKTYAANYYPSDDMINEAMSASVRGGKRTYTISNYGVPIQTGIEYGPEQSTNTGEVTKPDRLMNGGLPNIQTEKQLDLHLSSYYDKGLTADEKSLIKKLGASAYNQILLNRENELMAKPGYQTTAQQLEALANSYQNVSN